MQRVIYPKFTVIEDFLPPEQAQAWLDFALAHEGDFIPTGVVSAGTHGVNHDYRRSDSFPGSLGTLAEDFKARVQAALPQLREATGVADFPIAEVEVDLTAHRDGAYFRSHVDTLADADSPAGDRMLTAVWYCHAQPARFSGGELLVQPFGGQDEAQVIAPRHNRLVSFPSIARHEVATVQVPGNRFADARFAVNCWVLRKRA